MAIKCGHCKGLHQTIAEVRECSSNTSAHTLGRTSIAVGIGPVQQTLEQMPQRTVTTWKPGHGPMTEKQISFIKSLAKQKDVPVAGKTSEEAVIIARYEDVLSGGKFVSVVEAGVVIEWLLTLPSLGSPNAVPDGHYAIASRTGNNDLDFYWVITNTKGRWRGRTSVKRVIGGQPDAPVRWTEAQEVMEAITAAGIEKSAKLYAKKLRRCYKCNKHLTDETSRRIGMGPDCRGK